MYFILADRPAAPTSWHCGADTVCANAIYFIHTSLPTVSFSITTVGGRRADRRKLGGESEVDGLNESDRDSKTAVDLVNV